MLPGKGSVGSRGGGGGGGGGGRGGGGGGGGSRGRGGGGGGGGRGSGGRGRGGGGGGGRSSSEMEKTYGFFRCKDCHKTWESAYVFVRPGTKTVMFRQDCKSCNTGCFPYKTEPLVCSTCQEEKCTCTEEERQQKRHSKLDKPHLEDLCHKCKAGLFCTKGRDDHLH